MPSQIQRKLDFSFLKPRDRAETNRFGVATSFGYNANLFAVFGDCCGIPVLKLL